MSVSTPIARALFAVCRACEAMIATMLALLVLVNLAAVFWRYGLNAPLVWTEETLRYTMIWIALVGSAAAVLRNEHMGVDLLEMWGGPTVKRLVRALSLLVVAGFALTLLWYAIPMAQRNMAQVSPAARIPMVWPYAALVVGSAGMALNAIGGLALLALGHDPYRPDTEDAP